MVALALVARATGVWAAGPGGHHNHQAAGTAAWTHGRTCLRWPRAKLGRPVDGACPQGQVHRRSGEMMHVWFTDDRAPLAALRAANAA